MRSPSPRAVLAAYRSLDKGINTASGPVFIWPLAETPAVGVRIVLPGGDGRPRFGAVVRLATPAEIDESGLLRPDAAPSLHMWMVLRLATPNELRDQPASPTR